jgi:hypothetical protein
VAGHREHRLPAGGALRALARDGVLVDGVIVSGHLITLNGAPFARFVLRIPDGAAGWEAVLSVAGHHDFVVGHVLPVLYAPGAAHCVAFLAGRAVAASLK